jgi:uncharacterized protein (DUF433 family)
LSDSYTMSKPSAISRDPEIQGGTPVFAGTRVPVQVLVEYLAAGQSLDEFLAQYPSVDRELAVGALNESKPNPFRKRLFRRLGATIKVIQWRPPALPCHGAAIVAGPVVWEVELCSGSLSTAYVGIRLPWASYYFNLAPGRPHVSVCGFGDTPPPAADQPAEVEPPAEPAKIETAYDRMLSEKMTDPDWAEGYRLARARIDQETAEAVKARRPWRRWRDIRREAPRQHD